MVHTGRHTAQLEGEFVVFLIGMRINRPWKVWKWLPVAMAMPRMLKELSSNPDSGLLAYETWFGRTVIVLQYWRSADQLLAYANDRNAEHRPAWNAFNKANGAQGDVGIWHETYVVAAGACETMYVNMPLFGLGRAGQLIPAAGELQTATGRLRGPSPFHKRGVKQGVE